MPTASAMLCPSQVLQVRKLASWVKVGCTCIASETRAFAYRTHVDSLKLAVSRFVGWRRKQGARCRSPQT